MNLEKQTVAVSGIWIRKSMDQLEVLAEVDGEWKVVISEVIYGMSEPISHIVEPAGIVLAKVPAWLTGTAAEVSCHD